MNKKFLSYFPLFVFFISTYAISSIQESSKYMEMRKEIGADISLGIKISMDQHVTTLPDNRWVDYAIGDMDVSTLQGDVIFIFIDTLRYDVIQAYAPDIWQFMQENIGGRHISNSSATQHATFSLFHSQPSFLAYWDYHDYSENPRTKGSIFFRLLKKAGFNLYGIGIEPLDSEEATLFEKGNGRTVLESFFAKDLALLNYESIGIRPEKFITSNTCKKNYTDHLVNKRFIETYRKTRSKSSANNFYWVYYYNAHDPYFWDANDPILYPELNNLMGINSLHHHVSQGQCKKSYINSVISVNERFKELLSFLKKEGVYDQTTIALVSDHGESLGEKTDSSNGKKSFLWEKDGKMYGHGRSLYKEVIEAPYAFKFSTSSPFYGLTNEGKGTFYSLDFFPSLLAGLGMDITQLKSFIWGKSVLSPSTGHRSTVSAEPNLVGPTFKLALVNDTYKVQIQIDPTHFYEAKEFIIVNITDLNDKPIIDTEEFKPFKLNQQYGYCKDQSALAAKIKNDFTEALGVLFSRRNI